MDSGHVSASDWFKGIGLSILASLFGGASKLAIRKSWLLAAEYESVSSSDGSEDGSRDGSATALEPLSLDSDPPPDSAETAATEQRRTNSSWVPTC